MKSYGIVTIQDGVYEYKSEPSTQTGFASYTDFRREIVPKLNLKPARPKTFTVDLNYLGYSYIYKEGSSVATKIPNSYSKNYRRLASDKSPVSDMKNFVAQFAGCDEASKLRKRIIALTNLYGSVSSRTFRFGIEESP